jgi:DNA primase large subunit
MLSDITLSDTDLAKYTFTPQAASRVGLFEIKIDELTSSAHEKELEMAEARIESAIRNGVVKENLRGSSDPLVEILSYPIAIMLVRALGDRFLYKRYATAEAKRASNFLRDESEAKLLFLARGSFGWGIIPGGDAERGSILLHFIDYMRNASGFHEPKWKLVNRVMRDGYVRVSKVEAARLMEAEIERKLLNGFLAGEEFKLPGQLEDHLGVIRKLLEENRGRIGAEVLPSEVVVEAFPPCMRRAYEGLLSGRRASHMERFGLTSFLINTGMDLDKIVKIFVSVSDFDEELTRYQVEHIAGLRGGRTKYTPPTCSTLKTHGICVNPDSTCKQVRHPLNYYRRKIRQRGGSEEKKPK